ncbi:MAG: DUF5703 domain-containing protein, partial [Planctomycetota bacterium]
MMTETPRRTARDVCRVAPAVAVALLAGCGGGPAPPEAEARPAPERATSERAEGRPDVGAYDVEWDSPSGTHAGSVPLGNGDVGLNAWVEETGDVCFYISKTDSWGDNARLLKVGKVRVKLDPPPLAGGAKFAQRLRLEDATLHIRFGEGAAATTARVWVDANRPVVHVEVDAGRPVEAVASIELWRTKRETLPGLECSDVLNKSPRREKTVVEPDTVLEGLSGRIGWYHRNVKSVGPAITARIQGVADFPRDGPLLHRTFGAIVKVEGQGGAGRGERTDDLHLRSPRATRQRIAVHVLTKHPAAADEWQRSIDSAIAEAEGVPFDQRRAAHEHWWRGFWDRSWIHVTQGAGGTGVSPVPANNHPIRIGVDQAGGNQFSGDLGRVSVFENALSGDDVKRLAGLGREESLGERADVLCSDIGGAPRSIEGSAAAKFRKGLRDRGERYCLDVPCDTLVRDLNARRPRRKKAGKG